MPTEIRSRTTSRGAATSAAQPVRTRYSASTLRACAARTAAQPVSLGAHQEDLAGMGVRRPRLVVQVVAVVPDRHQAEILDGRERGGAGADDDLDRSAGDGQEGAVALGRPCLGGEYDVPPLLEPGRQGSVEPGEVAMVGHADQGTATRSGGGDDGLGQELGPVVAGDHAPDGTRSLTPAQPVEELGPARVVLHEARVVLRLDRQTPARSAPSRPWRGEVERRAGGRRTGCRRTSPRRLR